MIRLLARTARLSAFAVVACLPLGDGPTGNDPGKCPRVMGGDPWYSSLGCVFITGQLLRPDGRSIPYSSVGARYVLPGVLDSMRATVGVSTDGSGRFALSDVVADWRPAGASPATNLPVTVRLYANSGFSAVHPVDSMDVVAQFTLAGQAPPSTNIVWKTPNVP